MVPQSNSRSPSTIFLMTLTAGYSNKMCISVSSLEKHGIRTLSNGHNPPPHVLTQEYPNTVRVSFSVEVWVRAMIKLKVRVMAMVLH